MDQGDDPGWFIRLITDILNDCLLFVEKYLVDYLAGKISINN